MVLWPIGEVADAGVSDIAAFRYFDACAGSWLFYSDGERFLA